MGPARRGDQAAARRALQKAHLQQKGFHYRLQGRRVLAQASRQGFQSYGSAAVAV